MKKLAILVLALVMCLTAVSALAADVMIESDLTLTGDQSGTRYILEDGGNYTLTLNGTVTLNQPIWVRGGTLTVKGGTINTTDDAFIVGKYYNKADAWRQPTADAKLIIESGVTVNVDGKNCNCVYIFGTSNCKASLVTSGTLKSLYDEGAAGDAQGAAIQGNGDANNGAVTVNGGLVYSKNDVAIYHPQNDALIINGGKIEGKTGVEIRAGSLTVNGGEIIATGAPSGAPNGNGSTVIGAAVAVSQHNTNHAVNVQIKGGKLEGSKTLWEQDFQDSTSSDKINLSITGGTFQGSVVSENKTGFVSGGTFSDGSADKYVAPGLEVVKNNGKWVVKTFAVENYNLPQTGDTENLMMWVALMAMAMVGLVATRKMSRQ